MRSSASRRNTSERGACAAQLDRFLKINQLPDEMLGQRYPQGPMHWQHDLRGFRWVLTGSRLRMPWRARCTRSRLMTRMTRKTCQTRRGAVVTKYRSGYLGFHQSHKVRRAEENVYRVVPRGADNLADRYIRISKAFDREFHRYRK
jgi:hypothetical protein